MKVLIAMSGGVDSSVAAKLLCYEGYECIGCTMKLYDNCDAGLPRGRTCCSLDDVEDARSVAFSLGMRYYVFNFKDDFREKVIKKFASGYLRGQTPNPCIDCNRYMKFDKLFERAKLLGCDKLATGHYARIEFDGRKYRLKKALDKSKDQSYVLYMLTQEQLAHALFPLGSLHKTDTRAIADTAGLSSAHKPDSQDICFVPDGDYAAAIERLAGIKAPCGNFIDASGKVIGTHRGITHYTVGQHRGSVCHSPSAGMCAASTPKTARLRLAAATSCTRPQPRFAASTGSAARLRPNRSAAPQRSAIGSPSSPQRRLPTKTAALQYSLTRRSVL